MANTYLTNAQASEAQIASALADSAAVYAFITSNPSCTDLDLSTWAASQFLSGSPTRLSCAIAMLVAQGQIFVIPPG